MSHELLSAAIDSQFSAAAQSGPIPVESPLAALGLFSLFCQWNPETRKIDCGDIEWLSIEQLSRGQRNNPEVQELFRTARNSFSSRWDFWLLVVRSSASRRPNYDEAQIRIASQAMNEIDSIIWAQSAWKASQLLPDPELKKYFQIL